jgi:hypothetical protein
LVTAVGAAEVVVVLEAVDVELAVLLVDPVTADETEEVIVAPDLGTAEVVEVASFV